MKVIEVKKITAYISAIIFMSILFLCLSRIFSPVATTFINNHELMKVEKQAYKTYSALDGKFSFKLPSDWKAWNETFGGNEIIYHMYFVAPDNRLHGMVQVWKLEKPLKQFLEESKKSAVGVIDFKYYNIKEIMPNKKKGYLIEYSRAVDDGKYIKAQEAFIEGDANEVYRLSFYSNENDWKSYYPLIFNKVLKSFEIK